MKQQFLAALLLLLLCCGCSFESAGDPAPGAKEPADTGGEAADAPVSWNWTDPAVGYILTSALFHDDFAAFEQEFLTDAANPYTTDACFYVYAGLWDAYMAQHGLLLPQSMLAQVLEISVYRLHDQTLADVLWCDESPDDSRWSSVVLPDGIRLASADDFGQLPNLTSLQLACNTTIRSFRALNTLARFESLSVRVNDEFYAEGLEEIPSLRSLGLHAGPAWPADDRALAAIGAISGLESLSLSGGNFSRLTPLSGLSGLKSLSLSGCHVADWSSLTQLTQLEELRLTDGTLSVLTPLAALSELPRLHALDLSGSHITDVRPIAGLTEIRTLNLRCNDIADAAPLNGLIGRLDALDLSYNQIADLGPLEAFSGSQLDTQGNPKAAEQP